MKYVYVGNAESTLNGPGYMITLQSYGQAFDLPEDRAAEHIAQGASILPETAYNSLGHTKENVSKFAAVAGVVTNPANPQSPEHLNGLDPDAQKEVQDFAAKRDRAWALVAEQREKQNAPPAPAPPAAPAPVSATSPFPPAKPLFPVAEPEPPQPAQ